eukprot:GHVQ01038919.1.p1 GENE.GHVQ01038919.1~~GHVQ01038919.1.p1  ORF type:complete len:337 (-),score=27.03 GHVQ01038919.1:830-1840(-)
MGNTVGVLSLRRNKCKHDPVVVVTGATSGIGREIAHRYARRGCRIVLAARSKLPLAKVRDECEHAGSRHCAYVATDVSQEKECRRLMEEALKLFGRIDILILNAGVGAHARFSDNVDMDIYRKLLDINFMGYVFCVKYAWKSLRECHGQIVVISSMAGELGLPLRTAYCASKFAVTGFFEALRIEQGEIVSITICCPPSVNTAIRNHQPLRTELVEDEFSACGEHTLPTGTSIADRVFGRQQSPGCSKYNGDLSTGSESSGQVREGGLLNYSESDPSDAVEADKRMSVDRCVDYIMLAADKRARKVMFPLNSYLAVYVRPFFPDMVDPLLKRASKL